MSRLTHSAHLCFSLRLLLLPGGTISSVNLFPTGSWSHRILDPHSSMQNILLLLLIMLYNIKITLASLFLFMCSNHLSLAFLHLSVMFSIFYQSSSLSIPVSSCDSLIYRPQQEASHFISRFHTFFTTTSSHYTGFQLNIASYSNYPL